MAYHRTTSQNENWLPPGKSAAICFSIDDIHPSRRTDPYEAGGDLSGGALGHVEALLDRHPQLRATLFVTPDWRPIQLVTSRPLARVPLLSRWVHHVDLHPEKHFSLDRHPEFVAFLNENPRFEVAQHGLHHFHPGPRLAVEFQSQSTEKCRSIISAGRAIFDAAGLKYTRGFAPPGWNLSTNLVHALGENGYRFVASGRDLVTPIAPQAQCAMSGLKNVPLIFPAPVGNHGLIHFPVNFQATSTLKRADEIVRNAGLLSIKAHIFKQGGGHTQVDGLDERYIAYLDSAFKHLETTYGDTLWWTSMDEIAARFRDPAPVRNFT